MLQRWVIRVVASVVGLGVLVGTGYALKKYGLNDPKREHFKEGINASGAIRTELGHDCNLTVDPAPDDDEQVNVNVAYPFDEPSELSTKRDLMRNTNIVVRRFVHHIKTLTITFNGQQHALPSWDGGVAVVGAPVPIGAAPHIAAAEPVDAGTPVSSKGGKPTKPAGAMGSVTLVTFPDSDVFKGKDKLGRTPMFNVELPVGTHMLTLVGDDGVRHRLSMPVKSGKNKPLKMNLADLPAR